MDHGARITLGSDFPVEDMNPLAGFYAAITRVSREGTSPHGPGGWCVPLPPSPLTLSSFKFIYPFLADCLDASGSPSNA